jgi:hypothetical protein
MRSEESRLLTYIGNRYNDAIRAGETPADFDALLKDAIEDIDVIGRERSAELGNSVTERVAMRANHAASVRDRIKKRWGKALTAFDECIAMAEEITSLLIDNAFREIPSEEGPDSWVRRDRRDMVGGGRLKMLLLAGLQARACTISAEINLLLRTGFPQAAKSRNRTLYEQNVISFLLVNDETYEICERYHDSAPIEALRYFRSHNEHAGQLGWKPIDAEKLRDAEDYAAFAVQNWGPEIRKQYGWAAPLFPRIDPSKIRFVHLERLVEGESLRPGYVRMNDSIHAGPNSVINQADFRTTHLMTTRPTANDDEFADMVFWALRSLAMTTDVSAQSIMWLTESYDDYLVLGELFRRTNRALDLLNTGVKRRNRKGD